METTIANTVRGEETVGDVLGPVRFSGIEGPERFLDVLFL